MEKYPAVSTSPSRSIEVQSAFERWAFAFFLFTIPFQTRFLLAGDPELPGGEWTSIWLWVSDIAFLFLVAAWAHRKIGRRELKPLIFLAAFIPAFLANPSLPGLWAVLKLGEGLLLFSYVRRYRSWFLTTLIWPGALLVGIALNALIAIVQFALQHDLGLQVLDESPLRVDLAGVAKILVGSTGVLRAYGITPHPNVLAAVVLAGVAVVTFLYLYRGVRRFSKYNRSRQREELIRGFLLFAFLLGLLLTFSRTAWLSTLVFFSAVVGAIAMRPSLRMPYGWEAVRFGILFLAVAGMLLGAFWPFVNARSDQGLVTDAFEVRSEAAQAAIAMIQDDPLTGVGPGRFVSELQAREPGLEPWKYEPVHNVVLLLAAENGLPATFVLIIAFVLLFVATWRRVVTMHDSVIQLASICLLGFATGVLFFSLGDHFLLTSQQGRLLLWFTLGLLAP